MHFNVKNRLEVDLIDKLMAEGSDDIMKLYDLYCRFAGHAQSTSQFTRSYIEHSILSDKIILLFRHFVLTK